MTWELWAQIAPTFWAVVGFWVGVITEKLKVERAERRRANRETPGGQATPTNARGGQR
jgi:hypothetical protein